MVNLHRYTARHSAWPIDVPYFHKWDYCWYNIPYMFVCWWLHNISSKFYSLQCARSPYSSGHEYPLYNQPLSSTNQQTYLGILIAKRLTWLPHIKIISAKTTNMLNLLQRNLIDCSKESKSTACIWHNVDRQGNSTYLHWSHEGSNHCPVYSLVRPLLEYAWDPHYDSHVLELAKVQRRAARWVTTLLNQLFWQTLQDRRKYA